MRTKIFVYFLLLFTFPYTKAQYCTIKGTAPGAQGREIRVITYFDQISYSEKTIASDTIDASGNFNLKFINTSTIYAFVEIDFYKSDIYLEPDGNNNIEISLFKNNKNINLNNPFLNPLSLDINFIDQNENDINILIQNFNSIYNNFMIKNFETILKNHNRKKVEQFKNDIDKRFKNTTNKYFKNYIKYKIASIEQMSRIKNKANLAKKYIIDKPVLYDNIEYMDFFNNYFNDYAGSITESAKNKDLKSSINHNIKFAALSDIMSADTILKNERLRELVILQLLKTVYYYPDYKQKNIINILKQISEESKYKRHRLIAKNLIKTLKNLCPGTAAPDFTLKDVNNKNISLSDFKGKYVYINFITKYSNYCKIDMNLISELYEKYNDKIEFISISNDRNPQKFNSNYKWTLLYSFHNNELIKNYSVKSYPLYVFIDDKGNIIQYPAKAPDENIEYFFKQLVR